MNTKPARGMRDVLPVDARRREFVINIIKDVYAAYGFEPLETPAVENIETLTGKYGEEASGLIFKILKRGVEGEASGVADLALRYDLTVPLARVVAEYKNELPKFFKRYQIQPVYRAERPGRGRFREFYQCDVDAIGSTSPLVEAELLSAACDCYARLGFTDFYIKLNHRQVLSGILQRFSISLDKHITVLTCLDKLDKIGIEGVERDLDERGINNSEELIEAFKTMHNTYQSEGKDEDWNEVALEKLERVVEESQIGKEGITNLRQIINLSKEAGISRFIKVEPSLARGLSYYTGAIMEAAVPDLNSSIGGGGRYDNLIGMFGKEQIPACGFSIGLERILVVMIERKMFPPEVETNSSAQVLVAIWNDESAGESLRLANELRRAGIHIEVYPNSDKLAKQFKYAQARGIAFVAVIGDEEQARGEVTIKDLRAGEQMSVKRESAADTINARVQDANQKSNADDLRAS